MNIKQIKKEVDQLTDIENVLTDFHNHWIKPVKKHGTDKLLQTQIQQLRFGIDHAKYGQMINQKLKTLAHYLVDLRVTSVTNNSTMRSVVMHKFLHDPFLQLRNLIDEVNEYEQHVHELEELYKKINQNITEHLPLERKIEILDSRHQFTFQNILKTVKKQKQLLKLIGIHFLRETRRAR